MKNALSLLLILSLMLLAACGTTKPAPMLSDAAADVPKMPADTIPAQTEPEMDSVKPTTPSRHPIPCILDDIPGLDEIPRADPDIHSETGSTEAPDNAGHASSEQNSGANPSQSDREPAGTMTSEPGTSEPAAPQPNTPAVTPPEPVTKPTEPAKPVTEPTLPPTTPPAEPPTEPPTEPEPTPPPTQPEVSFSTSELEAYGRAYAVSLGFTIDASLGWGDSYYPGLTQVYSTQAKAFRDVEDQIYMTYANLVGTGEFEPGWTVNILVQRTENAGTVYDSNGSHNLPGYTIWVFF